MPPTHYLTLGFEQINSFQRPSTPRFPGSNRGQESRRSVPKAQYSKTARIFKKKQCTDRTVVEQRVRRCGQKQPESHRHWMTGWAVLKHGGPLGSPAAGFQRPSAPPRPPAPSETVSGAAHRVLELAHPGWEVLPKPVFITLVAQNRPPCGVCIIAIGRHYKSQRSSPHLPLRASLPAYAAVVVLKTPRMFPAYVAKFKNY